MANKNRRVKQLILCACKFAGGFAGFFLTGVILLYKQSFNPSLPYGLEALAMQDFPWLNNLEGLFWRAMLGVGSSRSMEYLRLKLGLTFPGDMVSRARGCFYLKTLSNQVCELSAAVGKNCGKDRVYRGSNFGTLNEQLFEEIGWRPNLAKGTLFIHLKKAFEKKINKWDCCCNYTHMATLKDMM